MTIKFSAINQLEAPTYNLSDIIKIKEAGATAFQLIQLHLNEKKTIFGIVGVNKDGKRMDGLNDLIALPCPPFCPDGDTLPVPGLLGIVKYS